MTSPDPACDIEYDPACDICGSAAEYGHHMAEETLQLCKPCIGRWVDLAVWCALPPATVTTVLP